MFEVINKVLLESEKPSIELKNLIKNNKLDVKPFDMIKDLKNINQNPKYHPEGDVLEHIFLVVDIASEYKKYSNDKKAFMWGALLHDIGKLTTTKIRNGKITSYNHDVEGEELSMNFLDKISSDNEFNKKVSKFVRWHMQPLFFELKSDLFTPNEMKKEIDYKEIALLSACDRLGRANLTDDYKNKEKESIKKFIDFFEI